MNRLLSSLPMDDAKRLLKRAEKIEVQQGSILHEVYEQPIYAYFPLTGACSAVTRTKSGHAVETGMLGNESCTVASYLMGNASVPTQYVQQIAGVSLRVPYVDVRNEFLQGQQFRTRILELFQVWALSMGQTIACQRLHRAEQRLARWLLMARQRTHTDQFQLSHEFLAEMLGSGRPKVTVLLLEFREQGLVDPGRNGLISLRDVAGLEATACECHSVITQLYNGLEYARDKPFQLTSSTLRG